MNVFPDTKYYVQVYKTLKQSDIRYPVKKKCKNPCKDDVGILSITKIKINKKNSSYVYLTAFVRPYLLKNVWKQCKCLILEKFWAKKPSSETSVIQWFVA